MALVMQIRDLKNANEISDIVHKEQEPVFITRDGCSDMVVMSSEMYERLIGINRIDLAIYESEKEMEDGGEAIELDEAFERLNKKYY